MKFSRLLRSIPCLLFFLIYSSVAFSTTGNELLQNCEIFLNDLSSSNPSINSYRDGFCLGYIISVDDTNEDIMILRSLKKDPSMSFDDYTKFTLPDRFYCIPKDVTNGQTARVVVKFLKSNPEILHVDASILVIKALSKYYPCNKN